MVVSRQKRLRFTTDPTNSDAGARLDYLCQGCGAFCGGDLGGPGFEVNRITADESELHVVVCAGCWDRMARPTLGDDYCEVAS